MAVTTLQSPQNYSPVYNPQIFLASSTQTAQPNFLYRIILTDLITSETQTYDVPADPDGYCRFNASTFAKSRMEHYCPINVYGWQVVDGVRKIRINIGEVYGTTPTYYAGSNNDWITWNAIENTEDFPDFDYLNYLYTDSAANYKYLTSQFTANTYEDRSDLFYVFTKTANDLLYLTIKTYDCSGNLLGFYKIENPYYSSTNYQEKYLCIDVGWKGLENISASGVTVVSGTLPIVNSNVCYYDVGETNSMVADPSIRQIKRYYVGCERVYDVYTIHFLRKNGAFESVHFSKRSDFQFTKEQNTYKRYPYERSGSTYLYSRSTIIERTLSTEIGTIYKLNTDWLTSEMVDLYQELFSSPVIYLDLGPSIGYLPLKYVINTYTLNKAWNEPLFQLQADFMLTHNNYRQEA